MPAGVDVRRVFFAVCSAVGLLISEAEGDDDAPATEWARWRRASSDGDGQGPLRRGAGPRRDADTRAQRQPQSPSTVRPSQAAKSGQLRAHRCRPWAIRRWPARRQSWGGRFGPRIGPAWRIQRRESQRWRAAGRAPPATRSPRRSAARSRRHPIQRNGGEL